MEGPELSSQPVYELPRWVRISIALFMLAVAAVAMWDKFASFDWAIFLSLGLYWLIYLPGKKGGSICVFHKEATRDRNPGIAACDPRRGRT